MRKILKVARREYVEVARTRTFWFSVLVPVVVGIFATYAVGRGMGQAAAMRAGGSAPPAGQVAGKGVQEGQAAAAGPSRTVAVLDLTHELSAELERASEQQNAGSLGRRLNLKLEPLDGRNLDEVKKRLGDHVARGVLDAYLVLPEGILTGDTKCVLNARETGDGGLLQVLRGFVGEAVAQRRLRQYKVPSELIAELNRGVYIQWVSVRPAHQATGGDGGTGAMMLGAMGAFFFLFLMFISIVSTGQMLLSSLIEERSSRVIEVLLSAVSPFQLMAGKVLGLAAIGLTMAAVCGGVLFGAAATQGLLPAIRLGAVFIFVPYYVLGFLLISSVFAAVGAACNTIKEAQTMLLPVMLVFILPMMGWMQIAQHPNGWLAIALSLFPPTAPMVMVLRTAASPQIPVLQIALSLLLLAVAAPLAMWASARIFRTAILMYGKPPSLQQLLRWARQK